MAVPPLFSQTEFERRIGPARLVQLLDDNRDGAADPAAITDVMQEATDLGAGLLLKAFTLEEIQELAEEDRSVRGALVNIACGIAGQHRPEFMGPDGRTLYWALYEDGMKRLREVAAGRERSAGEEKKGTNQLLRNRTAPKRPANFTFANVAGKKTGGGF